jgi:chromosome segregation ATPase
VEERLPSLERALDKYFDANFEAIIDEWGLLTDYELQDLERRLTTVTEQIDDLYTKKTTIEKRVTTLDKEIAALEGGVE